MARAVWDVTGEKLYETGVSNGMLYVVGGDGKYGKGVAWSGLSKVTEKPSGAEANAIYADNQKYLNLIAAEEFGATVEAYQYPDEFQECDGSKEIAPGVYAGQQDRKTFGMSYRTLIGSDTENTNHGYKVHIIYGALAAPSERAYGTVNNNPEAISFSWDVSTTPVNVPDSKPTAVLTIDSTKTTKEKMKALEDILYGTESDEPKLPLPEEVIALMKDTSAAG